MSPVEEVVAEGDMQDMEEEALVNVDDLVEERENGGEIVQVQVNLASTFKAVE